jgi:hypothetical protein
MMPTFRERQDLARQFATDIARMQHCLQTAGKRAEVDDIVYAWADYSDAVCAGWLTLPESEDELLAILLKHLPASCRAWQIKAEDARDGSGDIVLTLPEELLARTGWKAGDKLSIDVTETGALILQRVE